jgi:2-amino-4-hydroxy-6-hydroxymethyldihydropteridine diphosphokinase
VRKKFFSPNFDPMSDHIAYILIGSNLGDRHQSIKKATELILLEGNHFIDASMIYETEPWGPVEQPSFLNQVIKIRTQMKPEQLMHSLLQIEIKMGRIRNEKMGARMIDLDILFYDDINHKSDTVTIPHPLLHERRFVLTPLNEIATSFVHPVLKESINTLLHQCKDLLSVTKWEEHTQQH